MDPGPAWSAAAFTLIVALVFIAGGSYLLEPRAGRADAEVARTTTAPSPTPVATAPPPATLASAWVDQSLPPVIVVRDTTTITFRFRNVGTAEWRRGTPSEVRLGIVGPYDPALPYHWPHPERPAIQAEAVVRPGEVATFRFDVRGPRRGEYRLRVRPVIDGVAWLTDEGAYIDIEVR
jgi:hypothetical protein